MKHRVTHALHRAEAWIFVNPKYVLAAILCITVLFATRIPGLRMQSDFDDLLPQQHPFIQLHNEIRDSFGGVSVIAIAVEVEQGSIFSNEALAVINRVTQGVDSLPGVNHNLVSSLTHRTARKIMLDEAGNVRSQPYFDAAASSRTPAELAQLRLDVMADPRVYGLMVSPDMKMALIKAQLNQGAIDYETTFAALQSLRLDSAHAGIRIHATGLPVLTGWVYTYLSQILQILLYTGVLIVLLLVLYFRRLYGIALPLLGIGLSSAWGLGFMALLGYNLDPLSMPIPFLIAARATSHGVQLVERYYYELEATGSGPAAARNALDALFRPGSLAITVDALGIMVIALGAAPINIKLGYYAGFWAFSVIFTVHFMVPLFLSILPEPKRKNNSRSATTALLHRLFKPVCTVRASVVLMSGALALLLVGAWQMAGVRFGESEPGSPILNRDHDYNLSAKAINSRFPGSEELYVVARTADKAGIRAPKVLHAMEALIGQMMFDPELGGAKALPGLVRQVNSLTHNGDPRWAQLPDTADEVGGLLFAYMAASPTPGALKEFVNPDENEAAMVFYYKDHKASTIDRAIGMAKRAADSGNGAVKGLSIHLAGGIVGVNAAIDEANYHDTLLITPLVMLMAFVFVRLYYNSTHAGWLMVLPMIFSTVLTYGFMGYNHIGINVNTIPVIAVGIGVGIDYAIYIMDRIREEYVDSGDLTDAVIRALSTTGLAVAFTATTLVAGVIMWVALSDLRFQSDAATLLSVMLVLNAVAAMLLVPAWVLVFTPRFITAAARDADGVLQVEQAQAALA
ncbi:transporter [Janthinobacterium sp. BJB412]|nr:transporter [Janthinobacterium sp. BJB412]